MVKRVLDLLGSLVGLIVLSPGFAIIGIGIKLTSPGPVFFRQIRVGYQGKTFRIYKFRTMVSGADKMGSQVTSRNDSRITPIGTFLRRHKLDEYPQLINVLLGEMSFVGPRPEVPRYVDHYPTEFARIWNRKPGMTHRVSQMLRNEEQILATAVDPESMYIQTVLPWKLGLYEAEIGCDSVLLDFQTIFKTMLGPDRELEREVPVFDIPQVSNIPSESEMVITAGMRGDGARIGQVEQLSPTGTGNK